MDKNLKSALANSVIDTFSDMAFLDVEEIQDLENNDNFDNIMMINVTYPIYITIYLFISNNLQKIISNNIYGEENRLSDEDTSDCILEILNVLTGKFLEIYLGKSKIYKLDFPKVIIDFKSSENKMNYIQFNAEENIFKIGLII